MKLAQHATLIALLQHAGYEPINLPVVLGTQGSVYKSNDVALKAVGILSKTRREKVLTSLHTCAVLCLNNILKQRRFLERCNSSDPPDPH